MNAHSSETPPSGAVEEYLRSLGPDARNARRLLGTLLRLKTSTLDEIVEESGAPRRDVEHMVHLMGADAKRQGHLIEVLSPEAYAALVLPAPKPPDCELPERKMESILCDRPGRVRDLDQVTATAGTTLRRAAWLAENFELSQSRILMLGDHDATTLAFGVLGIDVGDLSVVDIDHELLDFLATQSKASCYFADLRVGLPSPLVDRFDLVITDPPYSPEGVGLFVARGLEAIEHHQHGRLVVSYGFPPASPALGLKVQSTLHDVALVYEAVLPDFNRYHGAQALGSRSSLYVMRPTRRSKKLAHRVADRTASAIYSHGRQSTESAPRASFPSVWLEILREAHEASLKDIFEGKVGGNEHIAVNLAPYHGRSLVHAVIGARAPRVDVLVANETEGLRDAVEQARTRRLLGDVRMRRSVDGSALTLLEVRGWPPLPPPFEPLSQGHGPLTGRRPIDLPLHALMELITA